jgi:hypothetical protein
VSPDFKERVEKFTQDGYQDLVTKLSKNVLGDSSDIPFASTRSGDTISIVVPLTMARGDQLAELILLLAAKIPTACLIEGTQGWVEPQWTAEASKQLMGMVSAIQGPPNSFASSTSPTDLTRLACWVTACNSALSSPDNDEMAVGSVVPTEVGGSKSASKYLNKVFGGLRAVSSSNMTQEALATLERLLKLWIKSSKDQAFSLIRKNKISWGQVLTTGLPTESKKVKGNLITQIKLPSKPSRSPFLSGKERTAIASILAPIWNTPDALRVFWTKLSAEEQHDQYKEYVVKLKNHASSLNQISSSVHSKLGHRKKWIHSGCVATDSVPSSKKDKTNEFIWSQNFFKTKTRSVNLAVALVFAPSHYLTDDKYDNLSILDQLFELDKVIGPSDITDDLCGVMTPLWKEWAERFNPDLTYNMSEIPNAETLADDNPYSDLPEASA